MAKIETYILSCDFLNRSRGEPRNPNGITELVFN